MYFLTLASQRGRYDSCRYWEGHTLKPPPPPPPQSTTSLYIIDRNRSCLFSISAAIHHGSSLVARQYAKYGCPSGLRGEVWKLILGLEVDDLVCRYFFTRCSYLRQGGDEKSRLQQTAYVNLYNVTKFPLYMSFSVPCEQRPFDLPRKIEGPLFAGYV